MVDLIDVVLCVGVYIDGNGIGLIDDLFVDKIGLTGVSFSVSEFNNAFDIFVAELSEIGLLVVSILLTEDDVLVSINFEVVVVSGCFNTTSLAACSMGRGKIIILPTAVLELTEGSVVVNTEVIEGFCS